MGPISHMYAPIEMFTTLKVFYIASILEIPL